ncbi:hypothetical protein ACNKHP_26110 [Shigella boydii]
MNADTLVIADHNKALAMVSTFGGENTWLMTKHKTCSLDVLLAAA